MLIVFVWSGATNRPQELDEAARRRLTKRLYIPLPSSGAEMIHTFSSHTDFIQINCPYMVLFLLLQKQEHGLYRICYRKMGCLHCPKMI